MRLCFFAYGEAPANSAPVRSLRGGNAHLFETSTWTIDAPAPEDDGPGAHTELYPAWTNWDHQRPSGQAAFYDPTNGVSLKIPTFSQIASGLNR